MPDVVHTREVHDADSTGPTAATLIIGVVLTVLALLALWWLFWGAASPLRVNNTTVVTPPATQQAPATGGSGGAGGAGGAGGTGGTQSQPTQPNTNLNIQQAPSGSGGTSTTP